MARKAIVDQSKCIGCGSCIALAPKSFKLDNSKAKEIEPAGDEENIIQNAIDSCPAMAISWKE